MLTNVAESDSGLLVSAGGVAALFEGSVCLRRVRWVPGSPNGGVRTGLPGRRIERDLWVTAEEEVP
jgi:hypothetical protein